MEISDAVRADIEAAIGPIEQLAAVGGGCISPTGRVTIADGTAYFLKSGGPELPSGMLAAEARGLRSLAATGAVRVPEVIATGGSGIDEWLLLEWLAPGGATVRTWESLGRGLARLHRHRSDGFGADADNYIGSLPQSNAMTDGWADFWRSRRLEPRLDQARQQGLISAADARRFGTLFDSLEDVLAPGDADGPSMLHGDLWGGNVHIVEDGTPALIDPSVYHGHREVDLAMAELFGGFGPRFFGAYREEWPLAPGYVPTRRAVYQLYYLLVHVNLFGRSYVAGTRLALDEAGV